MRNNTCYKINLKTTFIKGQHYAKIWFTSTFKNIEKNAKKSKLTQNLANSKQFTIHTLARKNIRPFADFSCKSAIFNRLEKYLKLTWKSWFDHQLLILMGDPPQRILVPKFSVVQMLQSVKLENAKKGPFY